MNPKKYIFQTSLMFQTHGINLFSKLFRLYIVIIIGEVGGDEDERCNFYTIFTFCVL